MCFCCACIICLFGYICTVLSLFCFSSSGFRSFSNNARLQDFYDWISCRKCDKYSVWKEDNSIPTGATVFYAFTETLLHLRPPRCSGWLKWGYLSRSPSGKSSSMTSASLRRTRRSSPTPSWRWRDSSGQWRLMIFNSSSMIYISGVSQLEVRLLFWEPREVQQVGWCRTRSRWERIDAYVWIILSQDLFPVQESHQDDSPREAGLPRHPAASRPFLCPCGVFRLCGTFGRDTQYSWANETRLAVDRVKPWFTWRINPCSSNKMIPIVELRSRSRSSSGLGQVRVRKVRNWPEPYYIFGFQ